MDHHHISIKHHDFADFVRLSDKAWAAAWGSRASSTLLGVKPGWAANCVKACMTLDCYVMGKHRDSKLRFGELLPVSVAFKTSHTALEADCPGNSGTKQEVLFTKLILESHSLIIAQYL